MTLNASSRRSRAFPGLALERMGKRWRRQLRIGSVTSDIGRRKRPSGNANGRGFVDGQPPPCRPAGGGAIAKAAAHRGSVTDRRRPLGALTGGTLVGSCVSPTVLAMAAAPPVGSCGQKQEKTVSCCEPRMGYGAENGRSVIGPLRIPPMHVALRGLASGR